MKIPEKINLKDKRCTLAHGFRGFSPCSTGSIALRWKQGRLSRQEAWARTELLPHGGQEAKGKGETHPLEAQPHDPPLPTRPQLPKLPRPNTASSGHRPSTQETLGDSPDPNHWQLSCGCHCSGSEFSSQVFFL